MNGADADPIDKGTHRTGVLFAAAVAGWATVAGVLVLVWLVQIVVAGGVFYLPYVILAMLLAAAASYMMAIPLGMGAGLLVLSVTRKLKLTTSWLWAVAGILGGLFVALVLAIVPTPIAPMMMIPVICLFAVAGGVAGVVAWREDRKLVSEA